jgi:hypothetical protein
MGGEHAPGQTQGWLPVGRDGLDAGSGPLERPTGTGGGRSGHWLRARWGPWAALGWVRGQIRARWRVVSGTAGGRHTAEVGVGGRHGRGRERTGPDEVGGVGRNGGRGGCSGGCVGAGGEGWARPAAVLGRLAEAVLDRDRRSARPFFDTWATWHLMSSGGLQRGPTLFAVR